MKKSVPKYWPTYGTAPFAILLVLALVVLSGCTLDAASTVLGDPGVEEPADAVLEEPAVMLKEGEIPGEPAAARGVGDGEDVYVPASRLIGWDVTSLEGEVTGNIQDVLIDGETGEVLLALTEYGGFAEIADTDLPAPLNAFSWLPNGVLVFNFKQEFLESLPDLGDNWPDLDDSQWDDKIVHFWTELGFPPPFQSAESARPVFRLSDMLYSTVEDANVGSARLLDFVIDLGNSRVLYALLDYETDAQDAMVVVPFVALTADAADLLRYRADFDTGLLAESPRLDDVQAVEAKSIDPAFDDDLEVYWTDAGYPPYAAPDSSREVAGATAVPADAVPVRLGQWFIQMPESLPAGPVTFAVTNSGKVEHNFLIRGPGVEQAFPADLQTGETKLMEVTLQPGEYTIICPIQGHADQDMTATVTVPQP